MMRHHLRAFRFSIFRREWQAISHLSMQNSRSKQAVGYSKESHLYSDVTAPSPAKISVNAFSPSRFSVQTRCFIRQTCSPRATHEPKGTEAHTLSECYSRQKLSKDISHCLIPLTAHTQDSAPRATHEPKGTDTQPSQNALINKLSKDISQRLIPVRVHIPDSSPRVTCPQSQTCCPRRFFISTQDPATGQARRSRDSQVRLLNSQRYQT
jgi:hypothetical protein